MRIRIIDPHWSKMNPDPGPTRIRIQVMIIYLRITDFNLTEIFLKLFFLYFPLIFVDNNLINNSKTWPFLIISICNSSDLSFKWKRFFCCSSRLIFCSWIRIPESAYFRGSGSSELNVANPTNPDSKHFSDHHLNENTI